jgi:hypothetical protein
VNLKPGLILPLLLAATAAPAEIVVSENHRHLSCRAEPGHWDSRTFLSLAPGGRISGRVRMTAAAPHPTYLPGAGFLFSVPRTTGTTTGVQIGLLPGDSENLVAGFRIPGRPNLIPFSRVPLGRWVPISVSLSADSVLEVAVAGNAQRRRIRPKAGLVPYLMCNSGSWEFELDEGMQVSSERFDARPR